jgi:hypothetical protein
METPSRLYGPLMPCAVPLVVMHPYRDPGRIAPPARAPAPATETDDRTIAIVLIAIGALRVAIAVAGREAFGVEATIAVLMMVLGLGSLVRRST